MPVSYPSGLTPDWDTIRTPLTGKKSTAAVFGNLNVTYLKTAIGKHMAFLAPDVGLTTHLGGVILATGVFDSDPPPDLFSFLREKRLQPFGWRLSTQGQFHSIAINEGLAALLAFAFGRQKFAIEGKERLIPIATIYDVFWKHAYTQLYYALYDRARFIAVGTPSGTSLSRESGTHQSIQTPAMFMGLPNIIYYEPALAYDMKVLYHWAIEQIVSPAGESVYLRLTTQEIEQPDIEDSPAMREQVIRGGYWLIDRRADRGFDPARNVAHVFATGAVISEAIRASELLGEKGIFLNVCNVTSWERLKRDWESYWADPSVGEDSNASYHLNDLIPDDEMDVPAVVVGDFTPQVADWLGSALGKTVPVLGPRRFSETGAIESVRRFHDIDAAAIVDRILRAFQY
jgi:pyruvate dehydrogenase E1 component